MIKGVFGKSLTYKFYPTENGEPLQIGSNSPSIYVFDKLPTRDEAQTGTNKIGSTITSWSVTGTSPYACTFTIPAITDPYPDSNIDEREYYLGINFEVVNASGITETVVKAFNLQRAYGSDSVPGVTVAQVKESFPAISSYLDDTELGNLLTAAEKELKLKLKTKGIDYRLANDLTDLNVPLAYMCLEISCITQIENEGDKFQTKAEYWRQKAKDILSSITIPIDNDADGREDQRREPRPSYIISGK